MHIWQVQEAKAKLTQLINEAEKEPQIISHRGIPKTVVMSFRSYERLTAKKTDVVSFFRNSPLSNIETNFERDKSDIREIDL